MSGGRSVGRSVGWFGKIMKKGRKKGGWVH